MDDGGLVMPRPSMRRPLYRPPLELRQGPPVEARAPTASSATTASLKDPEAEFGVLLREFGFASDYPSLADKEATFRERAEGRTVELRLRSDEPCPTDAYRGPFWVGEEFSRLFGTLDRGLRQIIGGVSGEELGLLVAVFHPWPGRQRPSRLRVEDLVRVSPPAEKLGLVSSAVDMLRLYVSESLVVTVGEKLLLAAHTGSEEMLEAVLSKQAGKKEAIEEIVEDKPLYDRIAQAPHGARVMQRMLEHMARCHQKAYQDQSAGRSREFRKALLRPCQELLDFSSPGRWRDGSAAAAQPSDAFRMSLAGEDFFPSRWHMSQWSPVLDRLLHGGFREGRAEMAVVSVDEEDGAGEIGREGLLRFLSLLHPCHLSFLWALLPDEHVGPAPSKNLFLQDLWELLFRSDLDLAFEVFRLAHKFEVVGLMELCIVLIEVNAELSLGERILLADSYYLPSLMARCLALAHSPRTLKRVFDDERLGLQPQLSHKAQSLLLRHLLNLS